MAWSSSPLVTVSGKSPNGGQNFDTSATTIDTTGVDFLVAVTCNYQGSGGVTVTDSKSNTWNPLTVVSGTEPRLQIHWSRPSSVGTGHYFSVSGTTPFASVVVWGWSGSHSLPFDAQSAGGTTASGTTVQPGSLTPAGNGELLITAVGFNASVTQSVNAPFTLPGTDGQVTYVSGANEGVGVAYEVQSTATARNPTWTSSASAELVSVTAAFIPASAGGGGGGGSASTGSGLLLRGVGQ